MQPAWVVLSCKLDRNGQKRVLGFFPMGGGILLFCIYGDFGGMFAINMAGGGRPGERKQVSTAQRSACDQLSLQYCRRF